jgi:hypothetical protein
MAIRVTLDEIQQWLSNTKYSVEEVDEQLEETSRTLVFSMLFNTFDVSTWVDATSTPAIVRKVISLWIAMMEYRRALAEEDMGADSYAVFLQSLFDKLMVGVSNGSLEIPEVPGATDELTGLSFYPTDDEDFDVDNARRFEIGQIF